MEKLRGVRLWGEDETYYYMLGLNLPIETLLITGWDNEEMETYYNIVFPPTEETSLFDLRKKVEILGKGDINILSHLTILAIPKWMRIEEETEVIRDSIRIYEDKLTLMKEIKRKELLLWRGGL